MKKTLSILMSILIVALSFAFVVSAEDVVYPECNCKVHGEPGECQCCIYCEFVDKHALRPCIVNDDGTYKYVEQVDEDGKVYASVAFCCDNCNGFSSCNCNCTCCVNNADGSTSGPDQILTDDQQEAVVGTFQTVLARVRAFFDKLFETIFEILRFDEIMGNN